MTLVPDAATPELWRDGPLNTAGVHALIIGISAYPHLYNGYGTPAVNHGGMSQLEVSAKSAGRIFDWLKNRGTAAGSPVRSCRLLLAPRPSEKSEVDALTQSHYGDATFDLIQAATQAWGDELAAAAKDPEANVAFFFFSGHGLEHLSEPSLLALDILNPSSTRGHRNAVSFNSLWQSVRTYGVDRALFFIDACRNAPELAKTLHIVGQEVLEPAPYPGKPPEAVVWLQATRMGGFAHQLPGAPATIFGQALLEALEGQPPDGLPYDRTVNPWRLIFAKLESHVKQRVRELVNQHSATKIQPVEPGGYPYDGDALVAEKTPTAAAALPPLPPPRAGGRPDILLAAGAIDIPTHNLISTRSGSILSAFTTALHPGPPRDLANFGAMHNVFGHESVTEPWVNTLSILDLDRASPVEPGTVTVWQGRRQEANHRLAAWVDLWIEPGLGKAVWIQAGGEDGQPSIAVAVPRDLYLPIPVRLDLTFRPRSEHWMWALEEMTARLAPPGDIHPEAQRIWGPLWEVQRVETLVDLARAGHAAEQLRILEEALRDKRGSPVAAAIGAALLVRSGALDSLHDWPRNLANWFPPLADGPILWAETILRRHNVRARRSLPRVPAARPAQTKAQGPLMEVFRAWGALSPGNRVQKEARRYFMKVAERGPPLLTPVLSMAARQASLWRRVLAAEGVESDERVRLEAACDTIERATTYAVSDGLFAAFVRYDARLAPHDVVGSRNPAPPERSGGRSQTTTS